LIERLQAEFQLLGAKPNDYDNLEQYATILVQGIQALTSEGGFQNCEKLATALVVIDQQKFGHLQRALANAGIVASQAVTLAEAQQRAEGCFDWLMVRAD